MRQPDSLSEWSPGAFAERPATFLSAVRPHAADPLVGRVIGGRLLVEDRIGAGALGVVYGARHLHLDQPVAVKVMHDTFQNDIGLRAQFHAEARAASLLDHPNLVRVLDFGEESDGTLWLAMELLDGFGLDEVLGDVARMPLERSAEIVLQVAAGLAHAHARGIVHGDVKPSNVVLVKRAGDDGEEMERAKICDFGVARTRGDAAHGAGTPAYMSPEQCLGEPLDARSDVYACGVLLYELLTGATPFRADDAQELLRQHVLARAVPPSTRRPGVDPRADAIVMRALEKDKDLRYGSMRDLRSDLRLLLTELGIAPAPSVPPPPPSLPFSKILTPPARMAVTPQEDDSFFARSPMPPPTTNVRDLQPRPPTSAEQREHIAAFLAARPSTSADARALERLLERGTVEDIAARVARLLARGTGDALLLLDDASRLSHLAERMLGEDVLASPYVEKLLQRAGTAGARALWSARIAHRASQERRKRFVSWLLVLGIGARPVLLAALRRLAAESRTHKHPDLVEDVLLALPSGVDRALAESVVWFLDAPESRIRELAAATLVRLAHVG